MCAGSQAFEGLLTDFWHRIAFLAEAYDIVLYLVGVNVALDAYGEQVKALTEGNCFDFAFKLLHGKLRNKV